MKIYTKTGDDGTTGLFGGGRVGKDAERVDVYGNVDELNAVLGQARALLAGAARPTTGVDVDPLLERIQIDLFVLGAELASNPKLAKPKGPGIDQVAESAITALELTIDRAEEELPPLTSFILPGGGPAGAALHHARTVCRRAERRAIALGRTDAVRREVVIYLNRLSDLLFVLARLVNHRAGAPETKWVPGR